MHIKTPVGCQGKVVVVIPAYNREKYIQETVDSVLSQTYQDLELVVVDDGSRDSTFSILQGYGSDITLLQHERGVNKGQSAAINLGIKSTDSEYIAILDSDDLFLPDKIEKQVAYLKCNEDVGLVYGNGYYMDEQGEPMYLFHPKDHAEKSDPERLLLNCYFLLPNNSLFRRSVFYEAGWFDEDLRSGQDHDMAIRMLEKTKFAYIDQICFHYRVHQDSISGKNASLRWNNGLKILKKAVGRYHYSRAVIRKRKAVLHFRIGQCFLEEKKYITALRHIVFAGLLDPMRGLKVCSGRERTGGLH